MSYDCAVCEDHVCRDGEDCYGVAEKIRKLYADAEPATLKLVQAAAEVEAEGYMEWPRALEVIRFAEKAGLRHLGVAFCIGLIDEARTYVELLQKRFEVSSVCCKACGVPKSDYGLSQLHAEEEQETMCSPLGQAELLNEAGADLNITIGLCVGHDALFNKHSTAPVTTLIVKDRVLAHNPAGALYSGYWRRKLGG
jgi:uncharacterized metal-binding protein